MEFAALFVFWLVLYGVVYNATLYFGVKLKFGPEWERTGRRRAEEGGRLWDKAPYDKDWTDRMITGYYIRGYTARLAELAQEKEETK